MSDDRLPFDLLPLGLSLSLSSVSLSIPFLTLIALAFGRPPKQGMYQTSDHGIVETMRRGKINERKRVKHSLDNLGHLVTVPHGSLLHLLFHFFCAVGFGYRPTKRYVFRERG
ncbi:hypothetical protein F5H01DRAFT_348188 [Linnemannia elongata]|nr:hypothetical protein F5H01DRAFT_348188 [Linnemannia elongata]